MVIELDIDELKDKALEEYRRVLREWETGRFYYRFREYVKQYSKTHWANLINHNLLCMVIAMSRLGIPITSSTLSWLSGKGLVNTHSFLGTLASNKIVEPVGIAQLNKKSSPRLYRLSPDFITAIYTRIADREKKEDEEDKESM